MAALPANDDYTVKQAGASSSDSLAFTGTSTSSSQDDKFFTSFLKAMSERDIKPFLVPREETRVMSEPTREEMDAKLEAVEARLETRLVSIESKLDRVFDRVQVSVEQSKEAKAAAEGARTAAAQTKWNILFTAVGVLTVLLAAWAIWMQGMEMIGTLLSAKSS